MKSYILLAAVLIAPVLQADIVTYSVKVNTSAIVGQSGNLDFQFNPGGPSAQAATALIYGFTTNGTLGPVTPPTSGDVTPANPLLPGSFTLGNSAGYNDFAQSIVFGNQLSFLIKLDGPAVTSPNGTATAGTTFGFSLYTPSFDTALLTSDPSGAVGALTINLDGSLTAEAFPNGTDPSVATLTPAPEPGVGFLMAGLLLVLTFARFRVTARRRAASR